MESTHETAIELLLRDFALTYPEATEDFPWGHRAMKVRKKAFLFMGGSETGFSLSVKLPESREPALRLPFTEPTGYGLGRYGWVSASFAPDAEIPVDLLRQWVDESYRAIAPKKLAAKVPPLVLP